MYLLSETKISTNVMCTYLYAHGYEIGLDKVSIATDCASW